jgi:hypothetical protein
MKRIQDIEKLSAAELERIGADESIPVPEDFAIRLPSSRRKTFAWSAAAAVLLFAGVSAYQWAQRPKDTFQDPYLAYVAVEQAFGKLSGTVHRASEKMEAAENTMEKVNYWK